MTQIKQPHSSVINQSLGQRHCTFNFEAVSTQVESLKLRWVLQKNRHLEESVVLQGHVFHVEGPELVWYVLEKLAYPLVGQSTLLQAQHARLERGLILGAGRQQLTELRDSLLLEWVAQVVQRYRLKRALAVVVEGCKDLL